MIFSVPQSAIESMQKKIAELGVISFELKAASDDSATFGKDLSQEETLALVAESNANLGYLSGMIDAFKILGVEIIGKPQSFDI